MCLSDDVRLIESEILALPIVGMFEHSSAKPAVVHSAILEKSYVRVHGSMIGSHRWQKTVEK